MDSNPGRPKLKHLQGFIYTVRIYAKANAFEMRTSNFKRSIQKIFYQNQTESIPCRDTLRLLKTVTIHYGILTSPYCIAVH